MSACPPAAAPIAPLWHEIQSPGLRYVRGYARYEVRPGPVDMDAIIAEPEAVLYRVRRAGHPDVERVAKSELELATIARHVDEATRKVLRAAWRFRSDARLEIAELELEIGTLSAQRAPSLAVH